MSIDETIELVTKMTIGPRDILVMATRRHISMAEIERMHTLFRGHAHLRGVPMLLTRLDEDGEADVDFSTMPDAQARKLYDVLHARFGDSR